MTKSPDWLTGYVESLDSQPLTNFRSDCPVCGKSNTFSVTDDGMQRLWYCFHADCNVKGRTGIKLTKEFASQALTKDKLTKSTPAYPDWASFETVYVRESVTQHGCRALCQRLSVLMTHICQVVLTFVTTSSVTALCTWCGTVVRLWTPWAERCVTSDPSGIDTVSRKYHLFAAHQMLSLW